MFNGPVFLNETIQANARAVNAGGISESLDEANALYSRLSGASFELVPSSFKGGTLYSGAPGANGDLSWTRGSDAFRTNASGLLQRVPWNLLQRSEDFDNAVWSKVASSITSNSTTAPDGNTTADTITDNSTPSVHTADQNVSSAGTYTFSVYAKKGTLNFVGLYSTQSGQGAFFNINTGAFSSNIVSAPTSNSITNVGNGWYRCAITTTTTSSSQFRIMMSNDGTSFTYVGSGQSIFIWGAQLVEGTTAQTYLPTTDRLNFPRLSYMYGSCPSVLLEPQRTNLVLRSEEFDNASWTKTRCSITANSTTAPDGNATADTLVEDTTATSTHPVSQAVTLTAAAQTFSIYAKAANRNWLQLQFLSTSNASAFFDLSDGVVGTVGSAATASITSVGSGWYRCIITTTTASGSNTIGIYPASANGTNSYTGNGTASLYIWGAQCE